MRLWSLHPKYLDSRGLVALWREALLARAVLRRQTTGCRHHPQLERLRAHAAPLSAINAYLAAIHIEAEKRGYSFDKKKIGPVYSTSPMALSTAQLQYGWADFLAKLRARISAAGGAGSSRIGVPPVARICGKSSSGRSWAAVSPTR
jgi:hypothetical protein